MNEQVLIVQEADAAKRLDSYLSEQLDGVTRSMAQSWIEQVKAKTKFADISA